MIDFVIPSLSTTLFCSLYLITFATFLGGYCFTAVCLCVISKRYRLIFYEIWKILQSAPKVPVCIEALYLLQLLE